MLNIRHISSLMKGQPRQECLGNVEVVFTKGHQEKHIITAWKDYSLWLQIRCTL